MEQPPGYFHADRVEAALASKSAARSPLVASWRRSQHLHALNPSERRPTVTLTEAELKQARLPIEKLIRAAQPSLDRLFQAVGGVGCCVLLANRDGVPVDRRGAQGDDMTFRSSGLWTGALWSEEAEGTNGIGTCLVEQRMLTIHRDQHFLTRNTLLSCTTAPIFDHEGQLAGALDVSSCRADLTEGFVGLISLAVADAVKRIEAENFRQTYPGARIITAPSSEGIDALMAVDSDDLVIGATRSARQALGMARGALEKPVPVADLMGWPAKNRETFGLAERGVVQRALARANGNVSEASRTLGISRATLHRKMKRLGLTRPH